MVGGVLFFSLAVMAQVNLDSQQEDFSESEPDQVIQGITIQGFSGGAFEDFLARKPELNVQAEQKVKNIYFGAQVFYQYQDIRWPKEENSKPAEVFYWNKVSGGFRTGTGEYGMNLQNINNERISAQENGIPVVGGALQLDSHVFVRWNISKLRNAQKGAKVFPVSGINIQSNNQLTHSFGGKQSKQLRTWFGTDSEFSTTPVGFGMLAKLKTENGSSVPLLILLLPRVSAGSFFDYRARGGAKDKPEALPFQAAGVGLNIQTQGDQPILLNVVYEYRDGTEVDFHAHSIRTQANLRISKMVVFQASFDWTKLEREHEYVGRDLVHFLNENRYEAAIGFVVDVERRKKSRNTLK